MASDKTDKHGGAVRDSVGGGDLANFLETVAATPTLPPAAGAGLT